MNDNDDFIICGWYTPDYAALARALATSIDLQGYRHDLVAVEKASGGWERNTMRKPAMILNAIERHPTKAILFLDVDCLLCGPLDELLDITSDVAVHFMVNKRSRGYGRMFGRSTTMLFRPTARARAFVATWVRLSDSAPHGWVDQHTLTEAITQTPGLSVTHLDAKFCAMTKDAVELPVIAHSGAARGAVKIPGWRRWLNEVIGRKPAPHHEASESLAS